MEHLPARKKEFAFLALFALAASCLLFAHALHYYPFISDDALISLRYAERFLEGKGLTWNDGERVKGYSNLLWVLTVAGISKGLHVGLVGASRLAGLLFMSAAVFALPLAYLRAERKGALWSSISAGALFFCLAAPSAVWAIGGLEQPLYAVCLAWAIASCFPLLDEEYPRAAPALAASAFLGGMCLTRPDGPLFTVAALAGISLARALSRRRWSWRILFLLPCLPVLFCSGQLAFRIGYYGEFVPNTALVKLAPSWHHFQNGAAYVINGLGSLAPFSVLAIAYLGMGATLGVPHRQRAIFLGSLLAPWLIYVAVAGGDIFPAWRHMLPPLTILSFAVVEGAEFLRDYVRQEGRRLGARGGAFGIAILFGLFSCIQFANPENRRAVRERFEWKGQALGVLLNKAFADEQPLLAVVAAGCLPFWSKLPSLDMLGLNDYYLPRHPPEDFGKGFLGHELANARYLFARNPDIISLFPGDTWENAMPPREQKGLDTLRRLYAPVHLGGWGEENETVVMWFRQSSLKVGVRSEPDRIDIPAYFMSENAYPAFLCGDRLVISLQQGQSVSLAIADVSGPEWVPRVLGECVDGIDARATCSGNSLEVTLCNPNATSAVIDRVVLTKALKESPAVTQISQCVSHTIAGDAKNGDSSVHE